MTTFSKKISSGKPVSFTGGGVAAGDWSFQNGIGLNTGTNSFSFPAARGTSGYILTTGGDGSTSWAIPALSSANEARVLTLEQANLAQGEPTGFENTNIFLDINQSTGLLTVGNAAFIVWVNGVRYSKSNSETLSLPMVDGKKYYVLYSLAGALIYSETEWTTFSGGLCPVAIVEYRASESPAWNLHPETHGLMPWQTHQTDHESKGSYRLSGMSVYGISVLTVNPTANSQNTYGVSTGIIVDEDRREVLAEKLDANSGELQYRVRSLVGATWTYSNLMSTVMPIGTTYPMYNQRSGGVGSMVEMASGRWVNLYIVANIIKETTKQFVGVTSPTVFTTQALALAESTQSLELDGFGAEYVIIQRLTYRTNSAYSAVTGRFRCEASSALSGTKISQTTINGMTPSSHGVLSGRSDPGSHPDSAIAITSTALDKVITSAAIDLKTALEEIDENAIPKVASPTENGIARLDASGRLKNSSVTIDDDGNLIVTGSLSVLGDNFVVEPETVVLRDNTILLNKDEVGAGVTAGKAGIEVERGSATNYEFVFDETTDSFRVGEVGSAQAVATREDSPTNGGVAVWQSSTFKFVSTLTPTVTRISTKVVRAYDNTGISFENLVGTSHMTMGDDGAFIMGAQSGDKIQKIRGQAVYIDSATGASVLGHQLNGVTKHATMSIGTEWSVYSASVSGSIFVASDTVVSQRGRFLLLNKNEAGAGVTGDDSGIEVERGSLENQKLAFSETTKRWMAGNINTQQILANHKDFYVGKNYVTNHDAEVSANANMSASGGWTIDAAGRTTTPTYGRRSFKIDYATSVGYVEWECVDFDYGMRGRTGELLIDLRGSNPGTSSYLSVLDASNNVLFSIANLQISVSGAVFGGTFAFPSTVQALKIRLGTTGAPIDGSLVADNLYLGKMVSASRGTISTEMATDPRITQNGANSTTTIKSRRVGDMLHISFSSDFTGNGGASAFYTLTLSGITIDLNKIQRYNAYSGIRGAAIWYDNSATTPKDLIPYIFDASTIRFGLNGVSSALVDRSNIDTGDSLGGMIEIPISGWSATDVITPEASISGQITYSTDSGQSLVSNASTIINFGNKVTDINDEVTTGSGWAFTPKTPGRYLIHASLMLASASIPAGAVIEFNILKGGSIFSTNRDTVQATATRIYTTNHSVIVDISQAEISAGTASIQVTLYQITGGSLTLYPSNLNNRVSITKISGIGTQSFCITAPLIADPVTNKIAFKNTSRTTVMEVDGTTCLASFGHSANTTNFNGDFIGSDSAATGFKFTHGSTAKAYISIAGTTAGNRTIGGSADHSLEIRSEVGTNFGVGASYVGGYNSSFAWTLGNSTQNSGHLIQGAPTADFALTVRNHDTVSGEGLDIVVGSTNIDDAFRVRSGSTILGGCKGSGAWTRGIAGVNNNHADHGIIYHRNATVTGAATATIFQDGSSDTCGYIVLDTTTNICAYVTSSDARKKTDLGEFSALDIVDLIKIHKYRWKHATESPAEIGVYAQEIQNTVPSMASYNEELDYWGVDYGRLSPIAIKAIQEQKAIIEAQQKAIEALLSRVEALENR